MKTAFVTGSTGFIGTKLVQLLLDHGYAVRGLTRTTARKPPELSEIGVEYVQGDITDMESLRHGMASCDCVFHLAAYAKNWSRDPKMYDAVNIQGTRNVFTVAQELNVEKIVWTSTIVTLGPTRRGEIGDETMPRRTDSFFTEYERSKTEMERESAQWILEGLPLITVNPTRVFGPEKRSGSGTLTESNSVSILIDDFRKGRFPILLNCGVNVGNYAFVDDVAMGHLLALEKGRIGQRYILGGENASLDALFRMVDRVDGKKRFQLKIYRLIPMLVARFLECRAKIFGVYPPITPGWVRTFLADWAFSCEKAKRELGYEPLSLEEGIRKTCEWLTEHR